MRDDGLRAAKGILLATMLSVAIWLLVWWL